MLPSKTALCIKSRQLKKKPHHPIIEDVEDEDRPCNISVHYDASAEPSWHGSSVPKATNNMEDIKTKVSLIVVYQVDDK